MAAYYSVIRYVPDPVADERLNIGVVAFSGTSSKVRFLNDWVRAGRFADKDISFLRDYAKEFSHLHLDEQSIRKHISQADRSIQFSEPRASLRSPEDLVDTIASKFLRESAPKEPGIEKVVWRNKSKAAQMSYSFIKKAAMQRLGRSHASEIVKKQFYLEGEQARHPFDVVIQNGQPYFGLEALSFEIPDEIKIQKDIDAAAFAVEDVIKRDKKMKLGIIAIPPSKQTEAYVSAGKIFKLLHVPFVPVKQAEEWAEQIIHSFPVTKN